MTMKLTIGIKALNEERKIAAAIESALVALAPFDGEVVLADSGSDDATVEIARRYPIRIVQLDHPDERSCGAGAQLAFQAARTEFFYLLDGDMVLSADFLPSAIETMEAFPDVAGVGGQVVETNTEGPENLIRAKVLQSSGARPAGEVDRLDGGGLYRTAAIRQVGYFADRNLHAFEEFELASRLRANGWRLLRLNRPAVSHHGHKGGGYRLLLRRLQTGYAGAAGEVLRAAIGRPHFWRVLRLSHIRYGVAVILWWLAILTALGYPALALPTRIFLIAALALAPLVLLTLRRGSLALGLYSLASWNVAAVGLILGLFQNRREPVAPIAASWKHDPKTESEGRR